MDVDALCAALEDNGDHTVDGLARRLLSLRLLKGRITELEAELEDDLVASMESDHTVVPGTGLVKRVERSSSTWRFDGAGERMRDDLVHAVANRVAVDVGTGEIDTVKRNIAAEAMRVAFTAIPAFTTLKRNSLGLRNSDYRQYSNTYRISIEELL